MPIKLPLLLLLAATISACGGGGGGSSSPTPTPPPINQNNAPTLSSIGRYFLFIPSPKSQLDELKEPAAVVF